MHPALAPWRSQEPTLLPPGYALDRLAARRRGDLLAAAVAPGRRDTETVLARFLTAAPAALALVAGPR
jgi:hypothetical protein